MPIITDIRRNRGLVEIAADGETVARVRAGHFEKCPVACGDEIDTEAYLGRLAAIQFPEAYEAALSSLDASARTARQLSDSLRRRGYIPPVIESVVGKLSESGLIDDKRYAQRMAETHGSKSVGIYAFQRKLRLRGIRDEDAAEALETFTDEQQQNAALDAGQKLLRKYQALPRREARAKLSQALARRGFGWDTIRQAIDQLLEED